MTTETPLQRFRRLRLELEIVVEYDELRERAGHDYGCGQRGRELRNRRRELELARYALAGECFTDDELEAPATADELERVLERIILPRLERARRQPRGDGTPPTIRTLETMLRRLELRLARVRRHEQRAAGVDELELAARELGIDLPARPGYCSCETPIMDAEHDAGCRRCGLPVDFTPVAA